MPIDLAQFHGVFFEESLEGLDAMEQSLLSISHGEQPDPDTINTLFRAAHSIKGGSGTFGFTAITDFTHVLETLLDEARRKQRVLTAQSVEILLQSSDCLRSMVTALQQGQCIDSSASQALIATIQAMLSSEGEEAATAEATSPVAAKYLPCTDPPENVLWKIVFQPRPEILMSGNEPLRLFRELARMGSLRTEADTSRIPEFGQLVADECFIHWTLWLQGAVTRDAILEVFAWVTDECTLEISPVEKSVGTEAAAPEAETWGAAPAKVEATEQDGEDNTYAGISSGNSSIRVGVDKVDQLINLVGELVITQSMLTELGSDFDTSKLDRLTDGLEQLMQNTKELQESVMRIRMLPISFAFNRFPRMVRDLAQKTGKFVTLKLTGESTELDKSVIEQIGDPLVHLLRNAIDHGIEPAAERLANGKAESGTIQLNAFHQGGNIVIEIKDDGRGLNTNAILEKAISNGLVHKQDKLSPSQIFDLIFEPGFSTTEVVTDISGRGVGMDVVRQNIKALGGRIEIESVLGEGSMFRLFLPLTLAIVDGQLVRVGSQIYIVPLISIVESLQINPALVNRVNGDVPVYRLRDDNVPIIPLYREFDIPADRTELDNGLLVVAEGEGQKIGLFVDELLGQQQVVIKSLASNYKRVDGLLGATILGTGSVALILDIAGLIRRISDRGAKQRAARKQHMAA